MLNRMNLLRIPNFTCLLCEQSSPGAVCEYCEHDTPFFSQQGMPSNLLLRPDIASRIRHSHYRCLRACGPYVWPLTTLIKQFKFHHGLIAGEVLANWFVHYGLGMLKEKPDVLLPVPVSYGRYFHRHYNQALALCRTLSKATGIPVSSQWASRKAGQTQHHLNRQQRFQNLHNAFDVIAPDNVSHVAIVDDVLTTGCTADVLARALKKQRPGMAIDVWAMAITPSPGSLNRAQTTQSIKADW